jgi:8-oxo-dGTP pyrophosphatase MutT (NUDIX family)
MPDRYKIVIVTVVDGDGHLLMIRRIGDDPNNGGKWEFPAGHVDGGELPELAAVREVFEETGLQVYLMPWKIDVPTKAGKAAQFLGFVAGGEVKPEPELAEDEHDRFIWIQARDLGKVKPTHRNMDVHLTQLLQRTKTGLAREPSNQGAVAMRSHHVSGRRRANQLLPTRMVRHLPEPAGDLQEAILVGDEVEIFLKDQASRGDDAAPEINGIVDRRNRNTLWIRPLEEDDKADGSRVKSPLTWKNDGEWAFIRVYRDPDQVIHYIKGNPYDPDKKTTERARGIGLILETHPPDRFESVFALMRNETPDLDRSLGQAPQSFDEVAPFHQPRPGIPPILHRVREVLRDSGLEPDLVDHVGNGRVMILTQDADLKKDIVRVLQKGGVEVKAGRRGHLIATEGRQRRAQSGGTTTIPIATDDEMMRSTIIQRKQKLERERARNAADVVGQQMTGPAVTNPSQAFTPNPSITLENPMTQVKGLEQYGRTEVLPGNQGIKMTFMDDTKMEKFQNDMKTNPMFQFTQKASRRGQRSVAGHLIRCFRRALRRGDYGSAGEFLTGLLGMGIPEESIVQSRLAGRDEWTNLNYYATGMGDLGVSRISRRAARSAPDL